MITFCFGHLCRELVFYSWETLSTELLEPRAGKNQRLLSPVLILLVPILSPHPVSLLSLHLLQITCRFLWCYKEYIHSLKSNNSSNNSCLISLCLNIAAIIPPKITSDYDIFWMVLAPSPLLIVIHPIFYLNILILCHKTIRSVW